ncbi:sensor histidine kinase [Streptomyces cavernae]|uniref:sensor histidine kinase n=1 Tax=Streptomyces cavernae TaxID=2259034 RepID=UPI000FEBAFC4|nr:histidine kinase [Streptomyces cavernae]
MRGPGAWWREQSTPQKVETYTRWSFHSFVLIEIASFGLAAFANLWTPWNWILFLMVCVHAALCGVSWARSLDWISGRRPQPRRMLWAVGVATAVIGLGALVLATRKAPSDEDAIGATMVFMGTLGFGTCALALGMRNTRRLVSMILGFALGAACVAFPLGVPEAAFIFAVSTVGGGFFYFTGMVSVWLLKAVYELNDARETRARLAVAEERLRFGRDLHDVIGRNLAVIALKSELAVQLARRERPEAVQQMIEVQRIAQESQREVREVVRGYREADLAVELSGAQGVLTAAGIECEISGPTTGLPAQVQSALGWVVREATTNVLHHGDAARCAVSLRVAEGLVVLMVENDGLEDGANRAGRTDGTDETDRSAGKEHKGSGLPGLRERLSAVGGTLTAGRTSGGLFRVTASVPLPETTPLPGPSATARSVNEVLS